ncbi:butyrophilin subfamily 1 member A1-like isoform X2 [Rhinatrema bivittatum]|nr:butyrophilin subfamily 1 member A1-like isoform X2 [Rhinatrema bivittatum]
MMVRSVVPAGFSIALFILNLHASEPAKFMVIASHQPITVAVGNDAVLSCHLSPRISAEDMEVSWLSAMHHSLVHVYQNKKDLPERQSPKYQGRTELIQDGITNGSVSLRIYNITPSDEGQYQCSFESSDFYNEAVLELRVTGSGTNPHVYLESYEGGGIKVVCRTSGWYPEPEMIWQEANGQHLLSLATNKTLDHYGLFNKETSLIVREDSNRKLSCCLRHTYTREERESTVYLEASLFQRLEPFRVAFFAILVVTLAYLSFAVYWYWKQYRIKEKLSAEHDKLREENEWRKAASHAVEVTLDLRTAHQYLIVTEDQKCARFSDTAQNVPDNPERFDSYSCVLGSEGFTSGQHYWELAVEDVTHWGLGVAKESLKRKGWLTLTPESGIWTIDLYHGKHRALTSPNRTTLCLNSSPRKIGVYLDYENGQLSFYNVETVSHIYTYSLRFTERIFPFFWTWSKTPIKLCF